MGATNSQPAKEWCWPWEHDWSKWADHSTYEKTNVLTKATFEVGIVQERRCKTCNAAQRRQVAG